MVCSVYSFLQWIKNYPVRTCYKYHILKDYLSLYKTKGLTTDEYYQFEFEKRDEQFRKSFLGLNEQRYYLDYLNPIKYYSISRNKFFTHKLLEKTGVKKAELFCYYQPEAKFYEISDFANNIESVLHILNKKNVRSCVIKTTESSHGDNVIVVKSIKYLENDAILTLFNGETKKLSLILGDNALIFERVIHQTKQFSYFNSSSVNTVRFMTTLYPDGTAKIIATFIKIGRAGKCVDNAGRGGNIDVCVELDSGKTINAIQFDGWRNIKEIEKHPDTGCQLNGVTIENWQSIKEEVKKFQLAFPYCKAAGWDIAITDDGPIVIEVNDFWDRTGQYFIRRGWRKEIRDCYLAWKNTGKNYKMYRQPNALKKNHLIKISSYE